MTFDPFQSLLPAHDFGGFDPEDEPEFTCLHCGRLYCPSEDTTSDEIFCCEEHRAADQAAYDASEQASPMLTEHACIGCLQLYVPDQREGADLDYCSSPCRAAQDPWPLP